MTTQVSVIYRREWIQSFERLPTVLRNTVTSDSQVEGKQAVFLIAGSGREAVGRGSNGMIPASTETQTQVTLTLAEEHDLTRRTGFNVFTGQSDQRAIMQMQGRNVINRAVDQTILDALATGTVTASGVTVMNKQAATRGITLLGNAEVPIDNQIYSAVTPAQWGALEDDASFSSADFVEVRPLVMGMPDPQAQPVMMKYWMGVHWFVHTLLPGKGTASAKCYMWHRSSVGYCYANNFITAAVGYDLEYDYSWARHSIYHGAVKLQNAGIVVYTMDDTIYS